MRSAAFRFGSPEPQTPGDAMDPHRLKAVVESLDGDYEVVRELGRGASSIVYLLRDRGLDRDVAFKVMRGGLTPSDDDRARLEREARLVARLHHPNIVRIFGTPSLPDGQLALLMEHAQGNTLREVLESAGALPPLQVLRVMRDIAAALAYAHRRRIVHRDVKPENIHVDEEIGTARLSDFGVAREWDQDSRLTLPGASLGTPAYMAPEQVDGRAVDARSDVYSLGLVGYEMTTGEHPWAGDNLYTIIFKQKNETPPMEVEALRSRPELTSIIERCLRKNPEERWESAESLMEALEAALASSRGTTSGEEETRRARETGLPIPAASGPGETGRPEIDWSGIDWVEVAPEDGGKGVDAKGAEGRGEEEAPGEPRLPTRVHSDPLPLTAWSVPRKQRLPVRWLVLVLVAGGLGYGAWRMGTAPEDGLRLPGAPTSVAANRSPAPSSASQAPVERPPPATIRTLPEGGTLVATTGTEATLVARVANADGRPVSDTLVRFRVEEGDASLTEEGVMTDPAGLAAAVLRLPSRPGSVRVLASLVGADQAEARFTIEVLTTAPGEASGVAASPPPVSAGENPEPVSPTSPSDSAAGSDSLPSTLSEDETVVPDEGPPPPASVRVRHHPMAVGGGHVCHVQGGRAVCRGELGSFAGSGSDRDVAAVGAGVSHGCALVQDGRAWCWGNNESGQLGDGSRQDHREAVPVRTDRSFFTLVAGLSHTCALDERGAAYCWGDNRYGQLGDGTRDDRTEPSAVVGSHVFAELVAGWNHTCGIARDDRTYCWGLNADGQLGDGSRLDRLRPMPLSETFTALAAGAAHSCGLEEGEVRCWGQGSSGQLGRGEGTGAQDRPLPVMGLPGPARGLVTGAVHACALLDDGAAWCWGQNVHGQLGNGSLNDANLPVQVEGGLRFRSLVAGGAVTCGIALDGTEYCWGMNQGGQLGDGTRTSRASPVRVGGEEQ